MPTRRSSSSTSAEQTPELCLAREDAAKKLAARIEIGNALRQREVRTAQELAACKDEYANWDSYNAELLNSLFTTDKFSAEYSRWVGVLFGSDEKSGAEILAELREDIAERCRRLDSISQRLELIPLAAGVKEPAAAPTARSHTNRVFVVHGHDEAAKESVARFLEKLKVEAVVLHEQSNQGRTIIEKLERFGDADFAVVLLTPDDIGTVKSTPDSLRPRARQNVVLELGYFIGRLGRERVCALHKGGLELPSDFTGVVYVEIDPTGGWRLTLARELKAAGFSIDMNNAL